MLRLKGANMDIDLTSRDNIDWAQNRCPWNSDDNTNEHRCAVKNVSICRYFGGIERLDTVICNYNKK